MNLAGHLRPAGRVFETPALDRYNTLSSFFHSNEIWGFFWEENKKIEITYFEIWEFESTKFETRQVKILETITRLWITKFLLKSLKFLFNDLSHSLARLFAFSLTCIFFAFISTPHYFSNHTLFFYFYPLNSGVSNMWPAISVYTVFIHLILIKIGKQQRNFEKRAFWVVF